MEIISEENEKEGGEYESVSLRLVLKRQPFIRPEEKKETRRFSVMSMFSKNKVSDKYNPYKDHRHSIRKRKPVFQTSFLQKKDPYTVIRVFFLVRKFIEHIKTHVQHKFLRNLSKHQINIVNDLSHFDYSGGSDRKRFSAFPLRFLNFGCNFRKTVNVRYALFKRRRLPLRLLTENEEKC